MRLHVFTIFDSKVSIYGPPFVARGFGEAERFFMDMASKPDNNVGKHPADFSLWHVGYWDDVQGGFESVTPVLVMDGAPPAALREVQ